MKTLFYQVHWTKKIENIVKGICEAIDCECDVCQVFGAPSSGKEIWFSVKEEDIDFVKNQMNNI
jgi:hypothetical protein